MAENEAAQPETTEGSTGLLPLTGNQSTVAESDARLIQSMRNVEQKLRDIVSAMQVDLDDTLLRYQAIKQLSRCVDKLRYFNDNAGRW